MSESTLIMRDISLQRRIRRQRYNFFLKYARKMSNLLKNICINAKNVVSLQREKKSTGVLKWGGSCGKMGQKLYLRYYMIPLSIH